MASETPWMAMPAASRAAQGSDYGTVLRLARIAAGLTLEEAAALAGVSASTLSRMETKPGRSWDVRDLRRLASVFGIPSHLFGLSRSTFDDTPASLSTGADRDGEQMRRRALIATTAIALTGGANLHAGSANAAHAMAGTIEDVIFGRFTAEPLSGNQLAAQLAAARADLRATRYSQLAQRLPRLLARAAAACESSNVSEAAVAGSRLAQAYSIATHLLTKLHDNGMAWATADRAVQAARASDDPLILAEAQRQAATVMRRTAHQSGAQRLVIDTARQLHADTGLSDAAQNAMYGQLMATASYTAALRDDRDAAWAMLSEADEAARQAGGARVNRFTPLDLAVYKISVARVLGDFGTAVDYARLIDPAQISFPERRARFWEETALAFHGRGRPRAAFHALLSAEKDTPQEVRFRPWAQQLTRELLTHNNLAGMRDFAARIGVS